MNSFVSAASVTLFALATLTLSACGPDDSSVSTASASAQGVAHNGDTVNNADGTALHSTSAASAGPSVTPATGTSVSTSVSPAIATAANPTAASDAITQNMQASLAADNQQVAPVMHYAPGDTSSTN